MRYLYIFIFLGIWAQLIAQTDDDCSLIYSGRVIDEHDRSDLSFATVYISELNTGVVSDSTGYFRFTNLCKGTYTVVVSHVSCEPDTLTIPLIKNTYENLFLEHHTEELGDIIILGQDLKMKSNSDIERSVGLETLERFSGSSLGDVMNTFAGVSSLKTGNSIVKPIIQGLYGSRVITINDGVRMQDMEWGDEHASTFDINTAGKITLLNGGSALRYGGDAVAGIIVIEPQSIPIDSLTGRTILQGATNGRGGSLTSELIRSWKNGWFGKIQGTLKRFGDFKAPDYQLTNTGVYDRGISLVTGRHTQKNRFDVLYSRFDSKVAILSGSHIGSIGDLVDAINDGDPRIVEDFTYEIDLPRQEVNHQLARVQYQKQTKSGSLQLQYDFQHNQRFEFDKRVGDDRNKPSVDLELTTHAVSGNYNLNQTKRLLLNTGVLYRYQDHFANPETGIKRLIPDYQRYEFGVYLTGTYRVVQKLILDAGVRYDYNHVDALKFYDKSRWDERGYQADFANIVIKEFPTQLLTNPKFNYHNISYAVGLKYNASQRNDIRFNYAFTQRAPNPSELFSDGLHHGAARIELGDLRMEQEKSHKFGLSLDGNDGKWSWNVAPYLNLMKDFIILEPTGLEQTIRGAFPVWEYLQVDARTWGIDGQVSARWHTKWHSNHKFRYVNGRDTQGNRPLVNMPAPQIQNSVSFETRSWNSLELTLESMYTFKQTEYPNNNFLVFVPENDSFEEVDISTPPDAYHLLNLQSSMQLDGFTKQELWVGFAIKNLTNTKYRDYLNRQRYFADELGRSFEITIKLNY